MTGVNNLTSKSSNGKVTPVFTEIPNMVDVVTDYLTWAKSYLKQYSKYVIICQFVGLDINVYNLHRGHMTDFDAAQTIINDGVITLNQVVTMLNRDDHLYCTMDHGHVAKLGFPHSRLYAFSSNSDNIVYHPP